MTRTKGKKPKLGMPREKFLQSVNWTEVAEGTREHLAECEARSSQILLDSAHRSLNQREVVEYRAVERNADECRAFLYALAEYLNGRGVGER